jgi:GNAT superfamily N-acetyltransferase
MKTATMVSVTFAEETLSQCWEDGQALLRQHWQEIAAYPDIPLDIDGPRYAAGEAAGALCIVTARTTEGRIVGYGVFVLAAHPHYHGSLQAHQDILYVHPDWRQGRVGWKLVQFCDAVLKAKGVQVVHQHVKRAHPALGRLLEHHGYVASETIYSKRLDKE